MRGSPYNRMHKECRSVIPCRCRASVHSSPREFVQCGACSAPGHNCFASQEVTLMRFGLPCSRRRRCSGRSPGSWSG